MNLAYTYDDVIILPAYSDIDSRSEVKVGTVVDGIELAVPVMSSPMDTVTGVDMALWISGRGGLGILHRYNTIQEQVTMVKQVIAAGGRVGAATGVNGDSWERTQALIESGVDLICIDIAHGHSKNAGIHMSRVASEYPKVTLMSGNIATVEAAYWAIDNGARVLRVGIGGGSACTTREVAGVGLPQFSAIKEIADEVWAESVSIVADGGVRKSADAVKALAAGADAVVLGGMLARYPVAAGETSADGKRKKFRGMASDDALSEYKGKDSSYVVEGAAAEVEINFDYENDFQTFIDGIRTGFAYLGSRDIEEARNSAVFRVVTAHGHREGQPHGVR